MFLHRKCSVQTTRKFVFILFLCQAEGFFCTNYLPNPFLPHGLVCMPCHCPVQIDTCLDGMSFNKACKSNNNTFKSTNEKLCISIPPASNIFTCFEIVSRSLHVRPVMQSSNDYEKLYVRSCYKKE